MQLWNRIREFFSLEEREFEENGKEADVIVPIAEVFFLNFANVKQTRR